MGCFLAITTASLTEAEKGGDVAATPKEFFEVLLQPALNKRDGTKKGAKIGRGGRQRPFDRLRAGRFDRLRAGDREFDGVPHKYMRLSEWRRAGERRLVPLLREDSEMQPASSLDGL
jgi:hypothetical protein